MICSCCEYQRTPDPSGQLELCAQAWVPSGELACVETMSPSGQLVLNTQKCLGSIVVFLN